MSLLTSTATIAKAETAEDLVAAIAEIHKQVSEAQTDWGGSGRSYAPLAIKRHSRSRAIGDAPNVCRATCVVVA